jgi:hypothetical protein
MLFMKGRPVRWDWQTQQVVECFAKSFSHTQPDEFCKSVYEYGPVEMPVLSIQMPGQIGVAPPEPKTRPCLVLPCRQMIGWKFKEAQGAPDKKSQVFSHAIEQNIDLCPRFSMDGYQDHPDKEPPT